MLSQPLAEPVHSSSRLPFQRTRKCSRQPRIEEQLPGETERQLSGKPVHRASDESVAPRPSAVASPRRALLDTQPILSDYPRRSSLEPGGTRRSSMHERWFSVEQWKFKPSKVADGDGVGDAAADDGQE